MLNQHVKLNSSAVNYYCWALQVY